VPLQFFNHTADESHGGLSSAATLKLQTDSAAQPFHLDFNFCPDLDPNVPKTTKPGFRKSQ
jgi:hypothetical protein